MMENVIQKIGIALMQMQNTTQRITAMQIIRYKAKRQMTIHVLKIMNVKMAIVWTIHANYQHGNAQMPEQA